jgi:predicted nuclease of predicted toxin-antitoxin system
MRILFDQNISFRIVRNLKDVWPEAKQVRELGLENKTDREIWNFAKENEYSIVTFDSDFFDLSNLFGIPPKIIWLRFGNRNTKSLTSLLLSKTNLMKDFLTDLNYRDFSCLELDD